MPAAGTKISPVPPTFLGRLHPAVRLGSAVLGIIGSLWIDPALLLASAIVCGLLLVHTGLGWRRQVAAIRPWLPAAMLILALHMFTSTEFAPLWHPSWGGLISGGIALLRVAATLAWLGLFARTSGLQDSVLAVAWWTRPLRSLGVRTDELGLVLAVALGTIPGVLAEGRRVETVVRLRRRGPNSQENVWRWRLHRLSDRVRVVLPLVESLIRRAESLTLSLRARTPHPAADAPGPRTWQLFGLAAWLVLLVWWIRSPLVGLGDWGVR